MTRKHKTSRLTGVDSPLDFSTLFSSFTIRWCANVNSVGPSTRLPKTLDCQHTKNTKEGSPQCSSESRLYSS